MCYRPRPRLAALGIALLASLALACGSTEPPVPTEIELTPESIALTALGETIQLTAAVTDHRVLASADAEILAAAGLMLAGLGVAAVLWPPVLAWPLGVLLVWLGVALAGRAWRLRRRRKQ